MHLKQCSSASWVVLLLLPLNHPAQALCEKGATVGHKRND
jgi:hypothetical protein